MAHRLFFGLALAQGALAVLAQGLWGGLATHPHEMLLGQALAVVAGFLLTRLPRLALFAIAALWVAARLAWALPAAPGALAAALSLAATAAIALPAAGSFLRGAKRADNLVFPALMAGFLLAEALFLLAALADRPQAVAAGRWLALGLVTLLILAMGGRLLGAAASGALQRAGGVRIAPRPGLERGLLALLGIGFTAQVLDLPFPSGPLPIAAGAVLIGLRLLVWLPGLRRGGGDLTALAAGQAWLCLGLLAWAAAEAGLLPLLPPSAALHLATVGGIGGTLLVMAMRASAQREGRPMPVHSAPLAAGLLGLAAVLRGLGLHAGAAFLWGLATLVAALEVLRKKPRLSRAAR